MLAYAILARLFPVIFVLLLTVKWVHQWLGGKRDATVTRCLLTCAATVLVVVVGVLAVEGDGGPAREYVAKIRMHREAPAANALGLGPMVVLGTAA